MKPIRSIRILLLAMAGGGMTANAQLPAFPGAEGYGSIATGGRGGDVYYVTNLNASGAGSFAEGISTVPAAGRTILFKVSGHIRLPSGSGGGLTIAKDRITVAGQTAPGDGICFWNNTMNLNGDDLVIRHIRWRYGKQVAGGDSVDINGSQRIILDHCDVMFATDENLSSFGGAPEHFTFQWSTNAWGLSGHSAGGLWMMKHATVHHSLWANNHTRNPKLIGGEVFDWANNLVFGWNNGFNMAEAITGGLGISHRVNIRNSTFVHGASTATAIYGGGLNEDGTAKFRLHMSDTALDGNNNGVLDVSATNHQTVSSTGYFETATAWPQTHLGDPANPVIGQPVSTSPRLTGYKKIMSKAGAVRMEIGGRPLRDEITRLCVDRVAALQRGIIADPLELNLSTGTAFAQLKSAAAPVDTDLDGMPDDWEEAVGYDKTAADNNVALTAPETAVSFFPPGSPAGYTRLEEYLHFKAVPHGFVAENTAAMPSFIEIDLRKYTSGFTDLPEFGVSRITGGGITQSGPGNAIVRFTPALDFTGRAGFDFTVTDSAGDTWTQPCCLLVYIRDRPRPISWVGDGVANIWDGTSQNFAFGLGATAFAHGDAVTINDGGSHTPAINLIGSLEPGSLVLDNSSKAFTLSGTGSISGATGLVKSGSAALTIATANSYSGITTIESGIVNIRHASALGGTGGGTTVAANARLELEGDITVTGEPLSLSGTGGASFFNGAINSKSGTNTWGGPISITASGTRLGAEPGATLVLAGPISGSSGITIRPADMTSTVILSGANDYSGDTHIFGGVIRLGASRTLPAITHLRFGASNVSGKLHLNGFDQEVAALSVVSGTANEITSAAPAILTVNSTISTTYSGRITGSLTLAKTGAATLSLTHPAALASTTSVHIDDGALNLTSPQSVTALRIGGVWQSAGTYDSANSSGRITGAGSLTVTTSGPPAFTSWIDGFPGLTAPEKLPYADPDADGSHNLAEFAFGGNPASPYDTGFSQLGTIDTNNDSRRDLTLTLAVRAGASFASDGPALVSAPIDGITYRIEGGTGLRIFNKTVSEVIPHLGTGAAKPGYEFKSFRLDAANGLRWRGFLRASTQ